MAQVYVHADSLEDCVVGLVVPDPDKFAGELSSIPSAYACADSPFAALATKIMGKLVVPTDLAAMTAASKDARVNAAIIRELSGYGESARLNGYEKLNHVYISLEPFTMENGLLTPTFKTKRYVLVDCGSSRNRD